MHGDLSKSQIERLGVRLVERTVPARPDLELLQELLAGYSDVLAGAVDRVRGLGLTPTSRIKNTGTILEKLERYGGSWLKSVQDLAGMRVVGAFDRNGQDAVVAQLVALFADERRSPKVVDRRAEPMHGYRAVHVIVFPEGVPVEIQVRTSLQHEWAEMFEKLADTAGRGIRYGEAPLDWVSRPAAPPSDVSWATRLSGLQLGLVELAGQLARLIDMIEEKEALSPAPALLGPARSALPRFLAEQRRLLREFESIAQGQRFIRSSS